MQENSFGFAHVLANGDGVSWTVTVILALMSLASWYLILAKTLDWWRMRRAARAVGAFWSAGSVGEGIERLRAAGSASPYAQLASQATSATPTAKPPPVAWPPASTRRSRWNAPCASN